MDLSGSSFNFRLPNPSLDTTDTTSFNPHKRVHPNWQESDVKRRTKKVSIEYDNEKRMNSKSQEIASKQFYEPKDRNYCEKEYRTSSDIRESKRYEHQEDKKNFVAKDRNKSVYPYNSSHNELDKRSRQSNKDKTEAIIKSTFDNKERDNKNFHPREHTSRSSFPEREEKRLYSNDLHSETSLSAPLLSSKSFQSNLSREKSSSHHLNNQRDQKSSDLTSQFSSSSNLKSSVYQNRKSLNSADLNVKTLSQEQVNSTPPILSKSEKGKLKRERRKLSKANKQIELKKCLEAFQVDQIHQYNHEKLFQFFDCHAELYKPITKECYDKWQAAAIEKMNQFTVQQLSKLLIGHRTLRILFSEEFDKKSQVVIANKMNQFFKNDLCNIFFAYASLGKPLSEELYQMWQNAAARQKFSDVNLGRIFYSYALQNMSPPPWLVKAVANLSDKSPQGDHHYSLLCKAMIAFRLRKFEFEANLFEVLKNKFVVAPNNSQKSGYDSNFQQSVYQYLAKFFPEEDIQEEIWFDCIAASVDIYIKSKNLIIEVDGGYHFFGGTKTYTPDSLLKNYILSSTAKVIHIPYFEWDELLTDSAKEEYLNKKIQNNV